MSWSFGKPNNNPQRGSAPLNNFDFDFGLGSNFSTNRSKSLNDQKNQNSFSSSASPSTYSSSSAQSRPSWTQNKPSWTHQPAPSQPARPGMSNPSSMVGDIFGKSWDSMAPSGSGIGIVEKNPNLFGDLVGSALGQGKSSSNVPLKNAAPVNKAPPSVPVGPNAAKSSYSMGNLADSLPKTGAPMKNFGGYSAVNSNASGNLGGPSMRSGGSGTANKDPFGSLVDLASKKETGAGNAASGTGSGHRSADNSFGAFQNATKLSTQSFSSSQPSAFNDNYAGMSSGSGSKMDDFGGVEIPVHEFSSQKQVPSSKSNDVDPLDAFFSSTSASTTAAPVGTGGSGSVPFSEIDDWNVGSEFGGNDMGATTELEGLPPPPAGVTASAAKNKGLDSHKQGQHADAIKWLSWALVLLEKAGENSATTIDVLSCRASCYKEVGEYKKAIADCTKVLADDDSNVSVLIQRALLYESTEKYKLGAEDLRTVLKIDPGNRLARSTIHRLTKMAD